MRERQQYPTEQVRRDAWSGLALALLLSCVSLVHSAAAPAVTQLLHRSWRTENGLPQNSVFCITQDRTGYIWVGTENGLARFDGVNFRRFSEETGIPHNFVSSLLATRDGAVWGGTRTGGLIRYRDGQFDTPAPHIGNVFALAEGADGTVWAGTQEGLFGFARGNPVKLTRRDGLPPGTIRTLHATASGALWIGCANGGLARLQDGKIESFSHAHLKRPHTVRGIAADEKTGDVWVAYDGDGVYLLRDGRFTLVPEIANPGESTQVLLLEDSGKLWVGTQHQGLVRYDHGKVERFGERDGLRSNDVQALFRDREGALWAGTLFGGLDQFQEGRVQSFAAAEGLEEENLVAIAAGEPGTLWLGSRGGGLLKLENGAFSKVPLVPLFPPDIHSLCQSRNGDLWIGTAESGVVRRRKDGSLQTITRAEGLLSRGAARIFERRSGEIWIGSIRQGISVYDPSREKVTQVFTNDFLRTHIRSFAEDSQGRLWIGTQNGLVLYASGEFHPRQIPELPEACIRAIIPENNGVLWLGTRDNGLVRWDGTNLARFDPARGLAHTRIYDMIRTATDFWLAGNRGIERVPVASLEAVLAGREPRVHSELLSERDGMRTSACSIDCAPGIAGGPGGSFWFATRRGLSRIEPSAWPKEPAPPQPVIEEVHVDDNALAPGAFHRVPPGAARLQINYVALSFRNPGEVRFRYRVAGVDKGWVKAGKVRQAVYYNLKPRRYTFEVSASRENGAWSPRAAVLSFTVLPRFYQTLWFETLAAISALGGAGSIFRWRIARMRGQNIHLERLVARRTRELRGEISQRTEAEERLRVLNANLEQRVAERTSQLSRALDDIASQLHERQRIESALARSEARLRRIVDSGMIGILFWQRDGRITDANNTLLEMIGYSRDDLEAGGIRWDEITPPEHLPRDAAALEEIRVNGICAPFEKEYIRKNGTRVPVLLGGASFGPDGERGVCFVLDIAERRAQEEKIQSLNHSLEARVEERTTELARANDQLAAEVQERRRVGIALAAFSALGQKLHSARAEAEAAGIIAETAHSLIPHQSCSIQLYGPENQLYPVINSNSAAADAPARSSISVPIRNGTRVVGVLELKSTELDAFNTGDASTLQALGDYCGGALDRIHAEEARRETERRFTAFMANAPALAWMKDAQLRYVFTNRMFQEYTGRSDLDITGKTDYDLWPEAIARSIRENDLRVLETSAPVETQDPFGEDGARVLLTLRFLFTTSNGERFVAGMCIDITEQKRAEEALHRLPQSILEAQEKERRRVARELHDGVNQAIASIKFRIQTAEQQIVRGDPRWQETCGKSKEMLDSVLQQVRRLSRNLRPGELDDFGLIPAARSACEEFEARTGIEVRFSHPDLAARLPAQLELSLYRIVQEALTNIEKYAGATTVTIDLARDENGVVMEISDNGRGFDPAQLAGGRKGLGLLHMRERASLAGGTFTMRSAPGAGVQLRVAAPVRDESEADHE